MNRQLPHSLPLPNRAQSNQLPNMATPAGDGRMFEKVQIASCSHSAKQGKRKSATEYGNSSGAIGAMEECLRRFKSPAAHVGSAVGMDLAGSDRHGSAWNKDATTLPNWVTSLISILGTSSGAMEECLRRFPTMHALTLYAVLL